MVVRLTRLLVVQMLVNFDRTLSRDQKDMNVEDFREHHETFHEFADGRKLLRPQSSMKPRAISRQPAAINLRVSESFIHVKVAGHANPPVFWTTKLCKSDGGLEIILMAGDIDCEDQFERVKQLISKLEDGTQADERDTTSKSRHPYPYSLIWAHNTCSTP